MAAPPRAEDTVLRLYDYLESGNSYKVRLLLHPLGVPFERVAVDILKGESRTQALTVMDRHLAERRFFVGDRYSVADIALYAYTHAA
jgi:glutathione S-transferase